MGDVLTFSRLKIGEIITLEIKGVQAKYQVLSHEGDNTYKLRVLEGEHRGKFCFFKLERLDNE